MPGVFFSLKDCNTGFWHSKGVLKAGTPIEPEEYALNMFGVKDPLRDRRQIQTTGWRWGGQDDENEQIYWLKSWYATTPFCWYSNETNLSLDPMDLPYWLRLGLLPKAAGLDSYSLNPVVTWGGQPGDYTVPGTTFRYCCYREAPLVNAWEEQHERVALLLNLPFYYEFIRETAEVLIVVCQPEEASGALRHKVPAVNWLGAPPDLVEGELVPLPYERLDFIQAPHPDGHLRSGWLYFGEQFLDRTAGGHWLEIAKMTHFLVMGTSGFGKSVFLNQILQGIRYNIEMFSNVYLVDLKGGVELWKYQKLGPQYKVVYKFEDLGPLMADLVALIEARFEEMRANEWSTWPGHKIFLVIDEYAQIQLSPENSKEERQKKQETLANLNKVSTLGRAAGVLIWAQLQKATSDVMDSSFRANLASQVCFKVPNKLTAASMFGDTSELMADPVKLQRGRFILFDASMVETHYLQSRVQV